MKKLHADWYDWALGRAPLPEFFHDRVAYYMMGANEWRYAHTLAAAGSGKALVLHLSAPGGAADLAHPGTLAATAPQREPATLLVSDPRELPELEVAKEADEENLLSQFRARQKRAVVFESAPLATDTEMAGALRLLLACSADTPDYDLWAQVLLVQADGSAVRLGEDIRRARFRNSPFHARAPQARGAGADPLRVQLGGVATAGRCAPARRDRAAELAEVPEELQYRRPHRLRATPRMPASRTSACCTMRSTPAASSCRSPRRAGDPRAVPGPALAPAPAAAPRLTSIDLMRGLVIAFMVLDHVRDFVHVDALRFDPLDPARTTALLYATRWITHLCAPTFVFLAGASAWLQRARGKTAAELARFLLTRGLWLVFLELTVIGFAWSFSLPFMHFPAGDLGDRLLHGAARGAGAIYRASWCLRSGCVIIAGHNLLDPLSPRASAPGRMCGWRCTFRGCGCTHGMPFVFDSYPVVPWLGRDAVRLRARALVPHAGPPRVTAASWRSARRCSRCSCCCGTSTSTATRIPGRCRRASGDR